MGAPTGRWSPARLISTLNSPVVEAIRRPCGSALRFSGYQSGLESDAQVSCIPCKFHASGANEGRRQPAARLVAASRPEMNRTYAVTQRPVVETHRLTPTAEKAPQGLTSSG